MALIEKGIHDGGHYDLEPHPASTWPQRGSAATTATTTTSLNEESDHGAPPRVAQGQADTQRNLHQASAALEAAYRGDDGGVYL